MDAKDNVACGFFASFFPLHCSGKQCLQDTGTPEKMKQLNSANLLRLIVLLLNYLWKASTVNVRTCEGYPGQGDVYHSGFHCPRLSDSQEYMYCCWPGNDSLKYCCKQEEFEFVMKVNLSEMLATYIYRLNKIAFYNMLNHTWIGKHLILPLFQRNLEDGIQQRNKGVTAQMTADAKYDEHRPLEGNV
ncbi:hypothetical protein GDO78_005280 [Eleutherodactylus coqui]|uniref:Shisa N-terminal domain-containing protein n=1 Tax=Eleutherodactylus coqui TaxID=57060 RepID=A0A8J6KHH2_ELECQ|nr:hypothetical protein GDO78_005280 [Eleutherodactylus coqui]